LRRVHLWVDYQLVPVLSRTALGPGEILLGPAILEEPDTTLVIPPGWTASLGDMGCVVAQKQS
jgi:N-methylhydantoinase A